MGETIETLIETLMLGFPVAAEEAVEVLGGGIWRAGKESKEP
jgi:hypothetical protein